MPRPGRAGRNEGSCALPPSVPISYQGGSLWIEDSSVGASYDLQAKGCGNWQLPFFAHKDKEISGLTEFPIQIVRGVQGIQVIVTWEED